MKAMLSQPMAGKTEEEIVATREKAVAALKAKGWEQARDCRLEHDAAIAYGLNVIYEE